MNNAPQSLSYLVVIQNQFLANLGEALTMVIVVVILYYSKELDTFKHLTARASSARSQSACP